MGRQSFLRGRRAGRDIGLAAAAALLTLSCDGRERTGTAALTLDLPLHLEEHLASATLAGSEPASDIQSPMEWRFDSHETSWKATAWNPVNRPLRIAQVDGALRIWLTAHDRLAPDEPRVGGAVYVDLPDLVRSEWGRVEVQVRTTNDLGSFAIGFNIREALGAQPWEQRPFKFVGKTVELIEDGLPHTYTLPADWSWGFWEGPWRQLGFMLVASEPAMVEILSVRVYPKEVDYASESAGVKMVTRENVHRRVLFMHTPGTLEYRIRVPESARLDVGLGLLSDQVPVSFRVTAKPESGERVVLLEEQHADQEEWLQRSVDLSDLAGRKLTLGLEVYADRPGTVALWAAPTMTSMRPPNLPNIVFYVIDGGGADYMSAYDYNRRTTPNLKRLADEGVVFERAYSNSTWTKPSTASFMTSLHHSVLGGYRSDADQIPLRAVTMAEHLHRAGYQTGVFVSNPYAATLSGLDREVDFLREGGIGNNEQPAAQLNEEFWRWRQQYPGQPYWAHFQTTDVHTPWRAAPPFAGLFSSPELRQTYDSWEQQLKSFPNAPHLPWHDLELLEKIDTSYNAFFNAARSLYDETMAQTDHEIGRLVARLKTNGEWENTLLIVAADHSTGAAHLPEPFPANEGPMFRSWHTRIPLIVVWPQRIRGGVRFDEPVSMIDILPTILELTGLPQPEVLQGRSFVPLLLNGEGWRPAPVILDEFNVDKDTGQLTGYIEMIDGRWGASLLISSTPDKPVQTGPDMFRGRTEPLLLYDLWEDPHALHSLHQERPYLVEKYTKLLKAQWKAHRTLADHVGHGEERELTSEQLEALRSLGYIQ